MKKCPTCKHPMGSYGGGWECNNRACPDSLNPSGERNYPRFSEAAEKLRRLYAEINDAKR
jgi:hypothetical protein